jgi:Concanavalin A-like lectin/glucanases superfamily
MKTLLILAAMLIASSAFAITDGSQGELPNGEGDFLYHYSIGSGSTAYDYSGNSRDGATGASTAWGAGQYGGGMYFDGDPFNAGGSRIDVPLIVGGDRTKITFQTWVKLDADKPGAHDLIMANSMIYARIQSTAGGSTVHGLFFDNGNREAYGSTTIQTDVWTHIAITYDGSNDVRRVGVFINGVLDGYSEYEGAAGFVRGDDLTPIIGDNSWQAYSWADGRNMKGFMDDTQLVLGETLFAPIPEPSMMALLGLLGFIKRKK